MGMTDKPWVGLDLQDGETHPNPEIAGLIETMHELFELTMDTYDWGDGEISLLYNSAQRHVLQAISELFAAKNAIAKLQGEPDA